MASHGIAVRLSVRLPIHRKTATNHPNSETIFRRLLCRHGRLILQRLGMAAFGCGTVNSNKNAPYRHSRAGGNPGIGFVGIRLAQTQIFGLPSYWNDDSRYFLMGRFRLFRTAIRPTGRSVGFIPKTIYRYCLADWFLNRHPHWPRKNSASNSFSVSLTHVGRPWLH